MVKYLDGLVQYYCNYHAEHAIFALLIAANSTRAAYTIASAISLMPTVTLLRNYSWINDLQKEPAKQVVSFMTMIFICNLFATYYISKTLQ